ncbi:MAG: 50S ribosomal protein L18a [Nanoarchaeota archaeon]|nr:50S ribosomal protein L18a [Nanoarchaeota archaeon]
MEFLIKGQFKKGDSFQKFSKKVSADTKTLAIHKVYSILGSNYKCKRNLIKIESVEEVK